MGLLYLGTPLSWEDAKKYVDHVRYHGITQFLHIWDRFKDRHGDELLWGDEVCSISWFFRVLFHVVCQRLSTWSFHLTQPRKMRSCLYAKLRFLQSSVPSLATFALVVQRSTCYIFLCFLLSNTFQNLRPNLSSRIWSLYARINPRFSLHWLYSRSPRCGGKHALSVSPENISDCIF